MMWMKCPSCSVRPCYKERDKLHDTKIRWFDWWSIRFTNTSHWLQTTYQSMNGWINQSWQLSVKQVANWSLSASITKRNINTKFYYCQWIQWHLNIVSIQDKNILIWRSITTLTNNDSALIKHLKYNFFNLVNA